MGRPLVRRFCNMFSKSSLCLLGQHGSCTTAQQNYQETVYKTLRTSGGPTQYILIFRQSSNPVCGFSMMEQVRLCAVWPMENWLGCSLNHIQGWTTVRESHSCALEQGSLGRGRGRRKKTEKLFFFAQDFSSEGRGRRAAADE